MRKQLSKGIYIIIIIIIIITIDMNFVTWIVLLPIVRTNSSSAKDVKDLN